MSTDSSELRAIVGWLKPPLHTDDNMLLEFSAPKALYNTEQLMRSTQFEPDPESIVDLNALPARRTALRVEAVRLDLRRQRARGHARCVFDRAGDPVEHQRLAAALAPKQLWVLEPIEIVNTDAPKNAAPAGDPDGAQGWTLLRQRNYGRAYDEFSNLCAIDPKRGELKLGLADALIGIGADPGNSKADPAVSLKKLHHARRAAREATVLIADGPAAWTRLAEAQFFLARMDSTAASFHRGEALNAWANVLAQDKAGLLKGTYPGTKQTEIETTFRMDAGDFLKFASAMALLKK